mgnify:CR=1 FL=1
MAESGFLTTVDRIDRGIQKVIRFICGVLILSTVVFTAYTVFMRYVMDDAPFWGDTVALFANIWLVMLALALAIRTRNQISMTGIYELGPPQLSFILEIIWNAFICGFGIFLVIYGWEHSVSMEANFYWELDDLSKFYPTLIVPISGFFIALAAVAVMIEDILHLQRGNATITSYFDHHIKQ